MLASATDFSQNGFFSCICWAEDGSRRIQLRHGHREHPTMEITEQLRIWLGVRVPSDLGENIRADSEKNSQRIIACGEGAANMIAEALRRTSGRRLRLSVSLIRC